MKTESRRARDARLRRILRHGDPAAGGKHPGGDEIAAMRRTVLHAAPAPMWFWRPALAGAAALLLAAATLLWLARDQWQRPADPPQPSLAASQPAAGDTEDRAVPEAASRAAPETDGQRPGEPGAPPPVEMTVAESLPAAPSQIKTDLPQLAAGQPLAGGADDDSVRQARTVRFQAPNGTRIIWTLNPSLTLSGT